jgi:hypothetical protein
MGGMAITPDTKDWTWVLERPCPECNFDASSFGRHEIAPMIRENADAWPELLNRDDVRERPRESTWSPLEYAAHVRDIYRVFRTRVMVMRAEIDPEFANFSGDDSATSGRYNEQDPQVVAREIVEAGHAIADDFEAVTAQEWDRTGRRSDGKVFTVESLGKYLLHDVVHHANDVQR